MNQVRAKRKIKQNNVRRKRQPRETSSSSFTKMGHVRDFSVIPDILTSITTGAVLPSNFFTTAVQYNGFAFSANSIYAFAPTLTNNFPYVAAESIRYNRFRVLKSRIIITMANREATSPVDVILVATTGAASGTTGATFNTLASLPGCKRVMLSPVGSGQSVRKISNVVLLEKLVGPTYLTQDEYSGTAPSTEPATLIYWQFAAAANASFTVTTGGLYCSIAMVQTVQFFEPERDTSITKTFKCKTVTDYDYAIRELKVAREMIEVKKPPSALY